MGWLRPTTTKRNPITAILPSCNRFLHARTGESGIRIAGRMRVAFAILYLYDLAVLGFWTIPMFILPSTGIIPYNTAMQCSDAFLDVKNTWTLLQFFPESDFFVWFLWYVGVMHGILLLLGIAPRFQLVGILLNLLSFHRKSQHYALSLCCCP